MLNFGTLNLTYQIVTYLLRATLILAPTISVKNGLIFVRHTFLDTNYTFLLL